MYSPKDIPHLEIMAKLANISDTEIAEKLAKEQAAAPPPELSLEEKLLSLCEQLRTSELTSQASALESSFLLFKSAAATHLYRVHDEDGEDLINFAHPDGDNKSMQDGELGDVETTLSRHQKILQVVNKQPTGKLANYVSQCKIVLAQLSDDSKKKSLASDFKDFANVFINEVNTHISNTIGKETQYYNIKLPSGKTVKDYFTDDYGIDKLYTVMIDNPDYFSESVEAFGKSLYNIVNLIKDIKASQDLSTPGWNYTQKPLFGDAMLADFNPYIETFESLHSKLQNGSSVSNNWHDQWFNLDIIAPKLETIENKLNTIANLIERHIINNQNDNLKKDNGLIGWFDTELDYIVQSQQSLIEMLKKAKQYQDSFAAEDESNQGLINVEQLKKIMTEVDKDFVSDLDFSSKDAFMNSLQKFPSSILQDCKISISNSSIIDPALKKNLIDTFSGVEKNI